FLVTNFYELNKYKPLEMNWYLESHVITSIFHKQHVDDILRHLGSPFLCDLFALNERAPVGYRMMDGPHGTLHAQVTTGVFGSEGFGHFGKSFGQSWRPERHSNC